jgi:pimeloyl-ACP methyl ester carboxylesterase
MTSVSETPQATSAWIDLNGPVHYVDHGGPAEAPLLVCVHGLGGSHANWAALAPLLTGTYRVLALDLAGFGLTTGRPRSSGVTGNRELLNAFLTQVGGGPVVLIGNSMGGLIVALQAGLYPETASAVVLIDPALPPVLSRPDPLVLKTFADFAWPDRVRRWLGRNQPPLSTEQAALRLLELCCADPSRIPRELIDQHLALARRRHSVPDIEADFLLAARSLLWALFRRRRYAGQLRRLRMPVMLLHGDRDRLVPIRAARLTAIANRYWRFEVAAGVGHVPMLEAPEWTAKQLLDWLPAALETERRQQARRLARSIQPAEAEADTEAETETELDQPTRTG